jgi:type II secretory pathway pseudopilin PulG
MKLTHTNIKRAKGMTLLELTVVILVLLSLISILFIGARAWKKGSDRSANILNVRNVQQAVRGHANMQSLEAEDALASSVIFTDFNYMTAPTPPSVTADDSGGNQVAVTYEYLDAVPAVGALFITNPGLSQGDGEYFYTGTATDNYGGEVAEW